MSIVDEALARNAEFARRFARADLATRPSRGLVVVTCMDARMQPESFLGLSSGDAHILRNAGAVVSEDVLRSLVLSTHLMQTRNVFVIGHTQCAIDGADEDDLRAATGTGLSFHAFAELDSHIQAQVSAIEASPLLPKPLEVHGFVYQVEDGVLRQVV